MLPLVLFILFLVLPVTEIYVIIQVGQAIGGWPTVGLLLAESLLGAWIVRHEGRRAWRALREAVTTGVLPERQLADAALVLAGGVLLLTPGFVTDLAGFVFVLPFTRPIVRALGGRYLARRMRIATRRADRVGFPDMYGEDRPYGGNERAERREPKVVRGHVVDDGPER